MDFICKLLIWSFIAAYWLNESSRKKRHQAKPSPATIAPTTEHTGSDSMTMNSGAGMWKGCPGRLQSTTRKMHGTDKLSGFDRRSAAATEILRNKIWASWTLR
jgi:hypothetical protein